MKRYTIVMFVLVFLACSQAQAQQLYVEPHMTIDPPEDGTRSDNDIVRVGGALDLGLAGAPLDSLPWLVGEVLAGFRPTRDAGLGDISATHLSLGVRAQLDGTYRPGVFARAGIAHVIVRQFDNTGASLLPIWSFGAMHDFHLAENFFFGFAIAWEQYMYDTSDVPDAWANSSIEWLLASARIGWQFGE